MTNYVLPSCCVICGLITIVCGLIFIGYGSSIINKQIAKRLVIKNGSETFDKWLRLPVPIKTEFYLFNVTNADEFLAGHQRPHVQEVGNDVIDCDTV